jgi:NitT/TauT family transport system substrate-binding protein
VQIGFDATPFLAGQVDALLAFWTTQAYEVETAGIKYRFLSVSEIPGLSQPSQVALAREETLRDNPQMLEKWLRATIKGARYNINNPDESGKEITDARCGGSNFDAAQETWLVKKSLPLYNFNGSLDRLGYINKEQVMGYANTYHRLKQIQRVPTEDELMDFSVLEKIYGP